MRDIVGRLAKVYDEGDLIAIGVIDRQEDDDFPYIVHYTERINTTCNRCSFCEIGVSELGIIVELVEEE